MTAVASIRERLARPARGEWPLSTYTLYVHDVRYAVPTLLTVEASGDERVQAIARQRLQDSAHYRAVEIWEDDRFVAEVKLSQPLSG